MGDHHRRKPDEYDPFEASLTTTTTTTTKRKSRDVDDDDEDDDGGREGLIIRRRVRREVGRSVKEEPAPWGGDGAGAGLGEEIRRLVDYVGLTREEQRARRDLVGRVLSVGRTVWPRCRVALFGSASTGLDWFESDVDLRLRCHEPMAFVPPARGVRDLADALSAASWVTEVEARPHAHVPVVCALDALSGVPFDVSFDDGGDDVGGGDNDDDDDAALLLLPSGALSRVEATTAVHRDVTLVFKVFFRQRDLDKPFTGGLGSYRLAVLVEHYLRNVLPKIKSKERPSPSSQGGGGGGGGSGGGGGAAGALLGFAHFVADHDFRPLRTAEGRSVSYHGLDLFAIRRALDHAQRAADHQPRPSLAAWLDAADLRARREAKRAKAKALCAARPTAAIPPPPSYY